MDYATGRVTRRGWWRQRGFFGGLFGGLILGVIATLLSLVFLAPHARPAAAANVAGNMTITMDDAVLTTAMRLSLQRVQSKLPFTVTNVTAATVAGDTIHLNADGPSLLPGVLGATSLYIAVAPVASQGALQFHILDSQLGGLSLPDFLDSAIESAMDDQFAGLGQGQITQHLSYLIVGVRTQTDALLVTARVNETSQP